MNFQIMIQMIPEFWENSVCETTTGWVVSGSGEILWHNLRVRSNSINNRINKVKENNKHFSWVFT